MSDSTAWAVCEGFEAERPKSAVLKTPSTWRPRWTPTSTFSALRFVARWTISCPSRPGTRVGCSQTPRQPRSAWPRRSWGSERPPLPQGGAQATAASVPRDPVPVGLLHAPAPAGGHTRVADGRLCQPKPRVHRQAAADRLDPGRVAPEAVRPSNAPNSLMLPTTAGVPRIPATSGALASTRSSPATAPRARSSSSPPSRPA